MSRTEVALPGAAVSPAVAIPWGSLDTGLAFERDARWFGNNLTQTLEPRLFYVYVPFRNQKQIPIFDTGLAEFNFPQLFSENRFTGGDRFGDANQVTTALTTRFLQSNGQEALRGTIGQRYYFSSERVGLAPTDTLRTFHTSDLLASVGGRLFKQRELAYDMLTAIPGVSCVKPQAALYMFPKLDPKMYPIVDDQQFITDLLLEERTLLVQGTGFNWPTPDHFRVVFLPNVDDLADSINRIARFLDGYRKRHSV